MLADFRMFSTKIIRYCPFEALIQTVQTISFFLCFFSVLERLNRKTQSLTGEYCSYYSITHTSLLTLTSLPDYFKLRLINS